MTEELKKKILYSNTILELLRTHKVIAIYLGGSRLFNLDSPNSDYDIIVITKDDSLNNHQYEHIPLDGYRIHLMIHPIQNILELIKNPKSLNGYHNSMVILDSIMCNDNNIIYCTKKFKSIKETILKHQEAITILCIEARLNAIYNTIQIPIINYNKKYYHYLLMYYLLNNFINSKQLHLTQSQMQLLKDFKTNRVIPSAFYESLKNRYPHKYFTSKYSYEDIYKEMKQYE